MLSNYAVIKGFTTSKGHRKSLVSIPELATQGFPDIQRLPVTLRILLESVLRNVDGTRITDAHVEALARWAPGGERTEEVPFMVSRVVLQDFTGVPLLVDLAAMRAKALELGHDPARVEPMVPVDLVVDHSIQVDHYGKSDALVRNMSLEMARNRERYEFLKWGMQAFGAFRVVPPGVGIVHQVNIEHFFPGVQERDGLCYPDTLVGTDSHTTMINGVGVVGWGVGGIEAEAAMLGQPVYLLTPDVIGVELQGTLPEGTTATDLVLRITELLRKARVVGKFVEFFGDGAAALSAQDRATIANMAPEYGATTGFFPPDEKTLQYLRATGKDDEACDTFEQYFRCQQMFGMPRAGDIEYTRVLQLDLASIRPSLAGPRRPQDRIELPEMRRTFETQFSAPTNEGGFGRPAALLDRRVSTRHDHIRLGHGDVLIAAITSCTNTSNPAVMMAAGLLARKAVARGLSVMPHIKTSLAPGSRVVTDYLERAGLLEPLSQLGFELVGYGCTTCIGNAGDLDPAFNEAIAANNLIVSAVLSGNRNFEARIHPSIRANYLASPPLVVAFALAGRTNIDLTREPLGLDHEQRPVYLRELWPSSDEIAELLPLATDPDSYRQRYDALDRDQQAWAQIEVRNGQTYDWPESTYIAKPPFIDDVSIEPAALSPISGARPLLLLGDSVTTDHISPAGNIAEDSPAGRWLKEQGVARSQFNSYGARRGQHEVMMRGTFANVRLRNLMLPERADGSRVEGGYTLLEGQQMSVFDASRRLQADGVPLLVFAGEEYGTGSSRDWAAKGTRLLGVRAVIARSFERIHRANLIGMGVLPLQFDDGDSWQSLGIDADTVIDIPGIENGVAPRQYLTLQLRRSDGSTQQCKVRCRIDTDVEAAYYRNDGILPYVLRQLLAQSGSAG